MAIEGYYRARALGERTRRGCCPLFRSLEKKNLLAPTFFLPPSKFFEETLVFSFWRAKHQHAPANRPKPREEKPLL